MSRSLVTIIVLAFLSFSSLLYSSDLDVIVSNVVFDDQEILDGLVIYQNENDVIYIPMAELFSTLKIPISVNLNENTAQGWFGAESETFYFSLDEKVVQYSNKTYFVAESSIIRRDNDIYVDINALTKWIPIEIEFNPLQLSLVVDTDQPMQMRIDEAKKSRWSKLDNKDSLLQFEPSVIEDESLFSFPFIDMNLTYSHSQIQGESVSGPIGYALSGYQLFSGLETAWTVFDTGGNETDPLVNMTFRKGIRDEFPVPAVKQFEFGDVLLDRRSLVHRSVRGRGSVLSTFANPQIRNEMSVSIEGRVLPGWDVELYQNGSLIDFIPASNSDQYQFIVSNAQFGKNTFLIVFYGPQGQIRQEVRQYTVGEKKLEKGAFAFESGLVESNRSLIQSKDELSIESETYFDSNIYYGLGKNSTIMTGFSNIQKESSPESTQYMTFEWSQLWPNALLTYRLADEINEERVAHNVALKSRFLGSDWTIDYKDFGTIQNDDSFIFNQYVSSHLELGYHAQFDHRGFGRLPFRVFYQQSTPQNDDRFSVLERYSWVLSKGVGRFFLNLRGDYLHGYETDPLSTLSLQSNLPLRKFNVRSLVTLDTTTDPYVDQFDFALTYRRIRYFFEASWRRRYLDEKYNDMLDRVQFRIGRYFKAADYSLNYSIDSFGVDEQHVVNFNYSFAILPTGRGPQFNSIVGDTGAALLHVFLDKNNNATFDEGIDTPLEGIGFKNIDPKLETDSDGYLLASKLAPGQVYSISLSNIGNVDSDTILASTQPTYRFATKSGSVNKISIPIIEMFDIDGVLTDSKNKPIQGIKVTLFDLDGNKIMHTTSEYDGYYLLHKVPLSDYRVSFDTDDLKAQGYSAMPTQVVHITNDSPVFSVETPQAALIKK